jgi:hypothetical protein
MRVKIMYMIVPPVYNVRNHENILRLCKQFRTKRFRTKVEVSHQEQQSLWRHTKHKQSFKPNEYFRLCLRTGKYQSASNQFEKLRQDLRKGRLVYF